MLEVLIRIHSEKVKLFSKKVYLNFFFCYNMNGDKNGI